MQSYHLYSTERGNFSETMVSGSVSLHMAYNAWGKCNYVDPSTEEGPPYAEDSYNARWGYLLDETGLYYCQNRYYDPGTGRFLTRDPISYSGGMNLYGYCGGSPVGAADPNGLLLSSPFIVPALLRQPDAIALGVLGGILPKDPSGLPPGWWQGKHGGDLRQPGGNGRYFPPGGNEEGEGLEFHPRNGTQNDHWHPVTDGNKQNKHLFPGDECDIIPDAIPESDQPEEYRSDGFWRADNPWAWAAGATIVAGAIIIATNPELAPLILPAVRSATQGNGGFIGAPLPSLGP